MAGVSRQGYALSNGIRALISRPRFSDAAFAVSDEDARPVPSKRARQKGATTQLHRARVLEVRIQSPPAVSQQRTWTFADAEARRLAREGSAWRAQGEFLRDGTNGSNPSPSSEESVANLFQALRTVGFNGSRTGSDLILARIAFRVFARYLGAGRLRSKTLKVRGLRLPAGALQVVAGAPSAAGVAPYLPLLPLVTDRYVDALTLSGSPGGPCSHWKSATLSRRTWRADIHPSYC